VSIQASDIHPLIMRSKRQLVQEEKKSIYNPTFSCVGWRFVWATFVGGQWA